MPRRTKKFARMMEETLTEYPQQTTIHGVKYLADRSSPIVHRIYWIIIFVISFSLLGNFVYRMGQRWLENEVVLIDESTPTEVYEIPFPAITICPHIKYKMDKFNIFNKSLPGSDEEEVSDFDKKFNVASDLCSDLFYFEVTKLLGFDPRYYDFRQRDDWVDTLQQMAPGIEDIFASCEFGSWITPEFTHLELEREDYGVLFSMILTSERICFTFNTIRDVLRIDSIKADFQYHNITRGHDGWDPDKGYTKALPYPHKGFVRPESLEEKGLNLILKANRSDITNLCPKYPIPNVGYKIALHSPTEYPQTYRNFILIEYGKQYQIVVTPKTTKTSIDLISISPEVRGCYFNEERKLKYYTFYNENNCRLECFVNYSMIYDNVVPFPLPRHSYHKYDYSFDIIRWKQPEYYNSASSHFEKFGGPNVTDDINFYRECKCLPACNSIKYGYTVNGDKKYIPFFDDDAIVITKIDILFNEPKFIGQKRVRLYTFDTMLSDFGGLLGLFIGGSMLSLFELFYFFIIRNYSKCSESKVVLAKN